MIGPTGFTGPQGVTGPTGSNSFTNYSISAVLSSATYTNLYTTPGQFDIYQINTNANTVAITLPVISSITNNKRMHYFTDVGGNLNNNNFILNTSGGNTIAGTNSITANINYTTIQVASNGVDKWLIL